MVLVYSPLSLRSVSDRETSLDAQPHSHSSRPQHADSPRQPRQPEIKGNKKNEYVSFDIDCFNGETPVILRELSTLYNVKIFRIILFLYYER